MEDRRPHSAPPPHVTAAQLEARRERPTAGLDVSVSRRLQRGQQLPKFWICQRESSLPSPSQKHAVFLRVCCSDKLIKQIRAAGELWWWWWWGGEHNQNLSGTSAQSGLGGAGWHHNTCHTLITQDQAVSRRS